MFRFVLLLVLWVACPVRTQASTMNNVPLPVASYLFGNSLKAQEADAPDLIAVDPLGWSAFENQQVLGSDRTVYRRRSDGLFDNEAGVVLNATTLLTLRNVFTVELVFSMVAISSYRRILDVSGRSLDTGFYVRDGKLVVYPFYLVSGNGTLTASTFYHVTITVNDSVVTVYLGGLAAPQVSTTVMDLGDDWLLNFFLDNSNHEYADGSLALIRLYNSSLQSDAVANLASDPFCFPIGTCSGTTGTAGPTNIIGITATAGTTGTARATGTTRTAGTTGLTSTARTTTTVVTTSSMIGTLATDTIGTTATLFTTFSPQTSLSTTTPETTETAVENAIATSTTHRDDGLIVVICLIVVCVGGIFSAAGLLWYRSRSQRAITPSGRESGPSYDAAGGADNELFDAGGRGSALNVYDANHVSGPDIEIDQEPRRRIMLEDQMIANEQSWEIIFGKKDGARNYELTPAAAEELYGKTPAVAGELYGKTPAVAGELYGKTPAAAGGVYGQTPGSAGDLYGRTPAFSPKEQEYGRTPN